ncbi:MAG: hypothetical protein SFU27_01095 [Thermonemataceae bacterium]|nr:hypothetical protein [Thermonemataceae bacterium]
MKHYYFLIFIFLFSTCTQKEEVEGLFVTGDFSANLSHWQGNKNNTNQIASFPDSTKISYPSYFLEINQQVAILQIKNSEAEQSVFYYATMPNYTITEKNILNVSSLKMFYGEGVIISSNQIVNQDDTKTVIIEGKVHIN